MSEQAMRLRYLILLALLALAACSAPQLAWEPQADAAAVEERARADLRSPQTAAEGRAQLAWLCLLHGRACAEVTTPALDGAPTLERTVRVALLTDGLATVDRAAAAWCDVAQAALGSPEAVAGELATAAAQRLGRLGRADPLATKAILSKRAQLIQQLFEHGTPLERLQRARALVDLQPEGDSADFWPQLQQATVPWSRRLLTGMDDDTPLPQWSTATAATVPAWFVGDSEVARYALAAVPPGIYHLHAEWHGKPGDPPLDLAILGARPLRAWLDGKAVAPAAALQQAKVKQIGLHTLDLLVPLSADGDQVWLGWLAAPTPVHSVGRPNGLAAGLSKVFELLSDPQGPARRSVQQWFPQALVAELSDVLWGSAPADAADRVLGVWPRHVDAVVSDAARHLDDGNAQLALRSLDSLEPRGEGVLATTDIRTDMALLRGRAYSAMGLDDLAAMAAETAAVRADGHCAVWSQALELAVDLGNKTAIRHILAHPGCTQRQPSLLQATAWRAIGRLDEAARVLRVALQAPAQARQVARKVDELGDDAFRFDFGPEPLWLRDDGSELWRGYQLLNQQRQNTDSMVREIMLTRAQKNLDELLVAPETSTVLRQRALQAGARAPWQPFLRDGKALAQVPDDPSWANAASTGYLLDQEIVVLLPQGGALRRVHQVLRVLSDEAADQVGEVRVAQGAELEFARTLLADGTVVAAAETADKETISLRAVATGTAVEYAQTVLVEPEDPATGATRLDPFTLQSGDGPTRLSEYVVLVPTAMMASFQTSLRAPPAEVRTLPGWTAHIYRTANVPRARIEPRAVRPDLALPSVQVATRTSLSALVEPWDERLAAAAQASSTELNQWQNLLLAQPDGLPRWQYLAQRLARGVQQSHDGGAPGNPVTALQQQRGDRAAVFYSLLQHQGVTACMVRVHTLARQAPDHQLAKTSLDPVDFPAELVRFELADGPHWYDPGIEGGLLDHLRSGLRQRPALLAGCKASERRISTPDLGNGLDAREVTGELDWRDDGSVDATFREHLTGAMAAYLQQFLTSATTDERNALFVELAKGVLPGAQVEAADIQGLGTLGGPLDLQWTLRSEPSEGRRHTLALGLLPSELGKDFAILPERAMPLLFGHGQRQQLVLTVRAGKPLQAVVELTGKTPQVDWQRRWQPLPNGGTLTWQLQTQPGVVEAEVYRAFASAVHGADAAEQIRLERQ